MSLLLLFRGQQVIPVAPQFSSQGPGQHTYLHFPTTLNVPLDVSTLLDVYLGDLAEIKYDVEEMRRRHLSIVMNQGEEVWLLPRILKGVRCPFWKAEEEQCSDPLDPRATCYNTGWIGGYHNPISMKVVIPPEDRMIIDYEEGVRREYEVRPWTVHTPRLTERMIMVRKYSGERYLITNVQEQRWRGIVMHQEFTMRSLMRGQESYAYNIPVPAP